MTDKEIAVFGALDDEDIDFSDIPETTDEDWKYAKVVFPQTKTPVSLRLDDDLLAWFKGQGKGYQSRMNAVLRSYMLAHRNDNP